MGYFGGDQHRKRSVHPIILVAVTLTISCSGCLDLPVADDDLISFRDDVEVEVVDVVATTVYWSGRDWGQVSEEDDVFLFLNVSVNNTGRRFLPLYNLNFILRDSDLTYEGFVRPHRYGDPLLLGVDFGNVPILAPDVLFAGWVSFEVDRTFIEQEEVRLVLRYGIDGDRIRTVQIPLVDVPLRTELADRFSVTVEGMWYSYRMGNDQPFDGNKFFVMDVTITNDWGDIVSLDTDEITLSDEDGIIHEMDRRVGSNDTLWGSFWTPYNNTTRGKLVYQLPEDVIPASVLFEDEMPVVLNIEPHAIAEAETLSWVNMTVEKLHFREKIAHLGTTENHLLVLKISVRNEGDQPIEFSGFDLEVMTDDGRRFEYQYVSKNLSDPIGNRHLFPGGNFSGSGAFLIPRNVTPVKAFYNQSGYYASVDLEPGLCIRTGRSFLMESSDDLEPESGHSYYAIHVSVLNLGEKVEMVDAYDLLRVVNENGERVPFLNDSRTIDWCLEEGMVHSGGELSGFAYFQVPYSFNFFTLEFYQDDQGWMGYYMGPPDVIM
jgi:hypothetical protein